MFFPHSEIIRSAEAQNMNVVFIVGLQRSAGIVAVMIPQQFDLAFVGADIGIA